MFAYIKGSLEIKTNNYVVIDVNGVGYKIFMSQKGIETLDEIGNIVKVYTYYYVREDNISLYGFTTKEELRMFELLLSVSGIGAKSAITMLSAISPSEFAISVISNDTSKLTKVPGIGNKTAARIILELKDKLKTEQAIEKDEKTEEVVSKQEINEEALAALQVLGYNKKEVEKILEKFDSSKMTVEEIIKAALSYF